MRETNFSLHRGFSDHEINQILSDSFCLSCRRSNAEDSMSKAINYRSMFIKCCQGTTAIAISILEEGVKEIDCSWKRDLLDPFSLLHTQVFTSCVVYSSGRTCLFGYIFLVKTKIWCLHLESCAQGFGTAMTSFQNDSENENATDICSSQLDSEEPDSLFYFILCGVIGLSIAIVGIVLNVLSLCILRKLRRDSVSVLLLQTLAFTDCIYLLGYIFNWSLTSMFDHSDNYKLSFGPYHYFFKYVGSPMHSMFLTASAWCTCLLTTHRYTSHFCKTLKI